jgi:antitoxin (DNA-binding transcriptional repressor) of toxin-antitoxin stability system
MYIVHMKRVTASEARRNWFRLLDEVAGGTEVMIERAGRRIVLRREDPERADAGVPDYSSILRVAEPERAHEWGWRWPGEEGELSPEPDES